MPWALASTQTLAFPSEPNGCGPMPKCPPSLAPGAQGPVVVGWETHPMPPSFGCSSRASACRQAGRRGGRVGPAQMAPRQPAPLGWRCLHLHPQPLPPFTPHVGPMPFPPSHWPGGPAASRPKHSMASVVRVCVICSESKVLHLFVTSWPWALGGGLRGSFDGNGGHLPHPVGCPMARAWPAIWSEASLYTGLSRDHHLQVPYIRKALIYEGTRRVLADRSASAWLHGPKALGEYSVSARHILFIKI